MPPKLKAQPKLPARRGGGAPVTPNPPPQDTAQPEKAPPNDSQDTTAEATAPIDAKESASIAPPKGRLDSLNPRATPSGAGIPSKGTLKFQPKVVQRRSKEERENLEQKYKPSEASVIRGRGSRGRGGRGRGRGRGGFDRHDSPAIASGPFALGSVITGRKKVIAERTDDRTSSKFMSLKTRVKGEDGEDVKAEYSSSDESDAGRMDVEQIYVLDERLKEEPVEEDEDYEDEWGDGAPVRIARREHVDRHTMVNTESSTKKGKVEKKAKQEESTFQDIIPVKKEPEEEDPTLTLPEPEEHLEKHQEPPGSPELKQKSSTKYCRRSSTSKRKPVLSTNEEKEEYARAQEDRMYSLRELGGSLPGSGLEQDQDDDVGMTDAGEASSSRDAETENQIFFFQFPILLPRLVPAIKPEPKPEPDDSAPAPANAAPIDLTSEKIEPIVQPKRLKARLAELEAPPPPGLLGQLRVHKSGRVSMLWGDPSACGDEETPFEMEVQRGADCGFLQEVVIMKEQSPYGDEDKDDKGRRKGVVYSLGQVKGKYVVSPDFRQLINAGYPSPKKGKKPVAIKKEES